MVKSLKEYKSGLLTRFHQIFYFLSVKTEKTKKNVNYYIFNLRNEQKIQDSIKTALE